MYMASLYASSNTARKVLIGFLVFAVVILFFDNFGAIRTGITGGSTNESRRFYMVANRIFGNLPEFEIPSISIGASITPEYVITSTFSTAFPDVSYVYQVLKPRENFQFLATFEETAAALGFEDDAAVFGPNDYRWQSTDRTRTLRYNSISQVWSLETDLPSNPDAKVAKISSDNIQDYEGKLLNLLRRLNFDSTGFQSPQYDIKFLDLNPEGEFITTSTLLDAEYAEGSVYRVLDQATLKPLADRPVLRTGQVAPQELKGKVYTSDSTKGSLKVLFSYTLNRPLTDVYEMSFTNFEYTLSGAYQIITPDEGFSRIQSGEGALVSLTLPTDDFFGTIQERGVRRFQIDARRTELAFYEPQEWIGYTFPIYVYYGTAELSDGSLANAVFFMDAVKRAN